MAMIFEFRKSITKHISEKNLIVESWGGATRRSSNLLEINTKPLSTVLYVKISNSQPGFWGLTRNQLDRLNDSNIRWFVVLLKNDTNSGYVFSREKVNLYVKDGTFELSGDGDHKVHENTDCNSDQAFREITELIARIL